MDSKIFTCQCTALSELLLHCVDMKSCSYNNEENKNIDLNLRAVIDIGFAFVCVCVCANAT